MLDVNISILNYDESVFLFLYLFFSSVLKNSFGCVCAVFTVLVWNSFLYGHIQTLEVILLIWIKGLTVISMAKH